MLFQSLECSISYASLYRKLMQMGGGNPHEITWAECIRYERELLGWVKSREHYYFSLFRIKISCEDDDDDLVKDS